jgi:hypothetical protein
LKNTKTATAERKPLASNKKPTQFAPQKSASASNPRATQVKIQKPTLASKQKPTPVVIQRLVTTPRIHDTSNFKSSNQLPNQKNKGGPL